MHNYYVIPLLGTTKCKVNTTADHEGPDEEYRYSFALSLTLVLNGGG
jgi:hypothetical protein